jgi:hypothetical protein
MSNANTGIKSHDDAVVAAEGARQLAIVGASQSAAVAADVLFHRAVVKSALKNNVSTSASMAALKELGVTGQ